MDNASETESLTPEELRFRKQAVIDLAFRIDALMRSHLDRKEAIDAYDMARILFREDATSRRGSAFLGEVPQAIS